MFERFTERSRKVMVLAQEESGRLRHDHVGTEHLLLGLIREGEGVAAQALAATGVTLDGARGQVEGIVGHGEREAGGQVPFTQRSKAVLEASLKEAMGMGHNHIGTEHLLLGLLREPEGVAARTLSNLGADPEAVRREVVGRLGETSRPETREGQGRLERTREVLRRSFGRQPREDQTPLHKLTGHGRRVVALARDEARRFDHNYVGTEHLLLGLLADREGVAARALSSLNVTLDEVRGQVESIVGYGEEGTVVQAPFTPRAKKILQLAERESLQLGDDFIGAEHVLLGLARETEGVAARVFLNLDVDPDGIRREVVSGLPERAGIEPGTGESSVELFRGRVRGIRAGTSHPRVEEPGMRVPVVVDLDYAYHVAREGPDGFETLSHDEISDLVGRLLEAREPSPPEAVVGLTGDLLLGEIPSIQEVTVTVTREVPSPSVSVSATFRR